MTSKNSSALNDPAAKQAFYSVIFLGCNYSHFSRTAIKRNAKQDHKSIQFVVMDDGSTAGNLGLFLATLEEYGRPYR